MLKFPSASRTRWLFCCAFIAAACETAIRAEEAPPQITVEIWLLEASLDKLAGLGLEGVFTSPTKARQYDERAPGGLEQLFPHLESQGLVHLIAHPKLNVALGQEGSLQTKNLTFDAETVATDDGRIRVKCRADHKEPQNRVRWGQPAGVNQRMVSFSAEMESGKMALDGSQVRTYGSTTMVVFVRATYDAAANSTNPSVADQASVKSVPAAAKSNSSLLQRLFAR